NAESYPGNAGVFFGCDPLSGGGGQKGFGNLRKQRDVNSDVSLLKAGNGFFSGCWLKPVFRALYQQHAPLIYVTFATYEGTGSGR
ncbi:hypothetical protein, partial [Enterobacter kobei]|uniref:hypothetical protein n=2 Tax=Enterobacter cloacae complex TaxID=354276 RepID=UPI003566D855